MPLLIMLALGAVGVGRVVQGRMALESVSREAARAAVLSDMPRVGSKGEREWQVAENRGRARAQDVANQFGWTSSRLGIELHARPSFEPSNWVVADAELRIQINIPIISGILGEPTVTLHSRHWERIDPFRSRLP